MMAAFQLPPMSLSSGQSDDFGCTSYNRYRAINQYSLPVIVSSMTCLLIIQARRGIRNACRIIRMIRSCMRQYECDVSCDSSKIRLILAYSLALEFLLAWQECFDNASTAQIHFPLCLLAPLFLSTPEIYVIWSQNTPHQLTAIHYPHIFTHYKEKRTFLCHY